MGFIKKIALLITLVSLIVLAVPSHVLAQSASVSAPATIDPGASSSASVNISAAEIGSFQLDISNSPTSVIRFDSISPGSGPSGFTIITNLTSDDTASVAGFMTTTPITGGANVANISFTAIGAPGSSTTINISGALYDAAGVLIPGTTFTGAPVTINIPPVQYDLTMQVSGNGSATGAGVYDEGTVVPITAIPDAGWQFVNWTGDVGTVANTSSANTTITMNGDYTITANFSQIPTFNLTMQVSGNGSTSPPMGSYVYPENTVVDITATPDAGWQFVSWTGDVADPNSASTTVTMDADKTVTANFSPVGVVTHTLTMAVNGNGSTSPPVGNYTYEEGTVVPITATPDAGWQFVSWTGDVGTVANTSSANTTITMNGDYTITANFSQIPTFNLTMQVSGNGSTTPAVGNYTYEEGTVVPITATPDSGWRFISWTGDVADAYSASTTVTMDADKTVTANFSPIGYMTLTMAVSGNGSTSPSVGDHTYEEGTVVPITAIPDAGWQFDSWTGDVADPSSASTTVTMDADKTVTANFSQIIYYTLTMAVSGNGSTSPSVGDHTYEVATVVPITATPDAGWQFDSWTGDVADPSSASTTVTMDADKTVTANFGEIPIEDTTPPVISNVLTSDVTKNSADIRWTTDEPGDSQVEYWASPGELTPLDGALVTEHLVHLTGLTPLTTYYYKVMSRDGAGNLTVSDEYTFTTAGIAATFSLSSWSLSLAEVDAGSEVTISFLVTNSGDLGGSYEITLTVNGVAEATKEGTLGAGASEEVAFTTTKSAVGTYLVSVDGLSFSFAVGEEAPPPVEGINWWLIVGIIVGVLLLLALLVILARKGKLPARLLPITPLTGKEARDAEEIARAAREATEEAKKAREAEAKAMKEVAKARQGAKEAAEEARKAREAEEKASEEARAAKETARREAEEAKRAREAAAKAMAGDKAEAMRQVQETIDRTQKEAAEAKAIAEREAKEARKAREAEEKASKEARAAKETAKREAEEAKRAREAEARAIKEVARARERAREAEARAGKEAAEAEEAMVGARREVEEVDRARRQPVSRLDVGAGKAGLMLTVTALAAEKMKEAIRARTTDPEAGFRLIPSPSKPNQLKIVLDRERDRDQVVESEGVKVLFLSPEVAPMLEGMVIDYQETPQGGGFTISRIAPE